MSVDFWTLFVQEWNSLVSLFHAEGRAGVERRHAENREAEKESMRYRAALSRGSVGRTRLNEAEQFQLKSAGEVRRAVLIRLSASTRFLKRLDIQPDVWALDAVHSGSQTKELLDRLDYDAPLQYPPIAEYDAITEGLRTWKRCADRVSAAGSEEEGLRIVRIGMEELEHEVKGRSSRANQRIWNATHDVPPLPRTDSDKENHEDRIARFERSAAQWERIAPHVERGILYTTPEVFELSVMRRFLHYVHKTHQLYPPDWDFLIAISPHPSSWCVSRQPAKEPDLLRLADAARRENITAEGLGKTTEFYKWCGKHLGKGQTAVIDRLKKWGIYAQGTRGKAAENLAEMINRLRSCSALLPNTSENRNL